MRDHFVGKLLGRFACRIETQFRLSRRLIGVVDPGKAFDFAGAGLFIKPFGVAGLTDVDRGIDKDFDKVSGLEARSNRVAGAALVPYAAWCGFATALSAAVARRNRGLRGNRPS